MSLLQSIMHRVIRAILRFVCRVQSEQLSRVPQNGPLLLILNHINFLEAPLLATHFGSRPLTGVAKEETWDNPFKGFLFSLWKGIPVRRGSADRSALRLVLEALAADQIVALAPEGTRSYHGALQEGHPGILLMALRSGAPILPVVLHGHEYFWQNLRKFRRTDVCFEVGNPFYLDDHGDITIREARAQMVREVMYQLAALLPPKNRGLYADLENATSKYLRFAAGVQNNLEAVNCDECSRRSAAGVRFLRTPAL